MLCQYSGGGSMNSSRGRFRVQVRGNFHILASKKNSGIFKPPTPPPFGSATGISCDLVPDGILKKCLFRFNVNEVTGQIRLAKKLDFERQSMLEMQYEARDLGGKIARVPFSVSVLNFNEQGPVFRQEKYEVSLTESSSSFLLYILVSLTILSASKI